MTRFIVDPTGDLDIMVSEPLQMRQATWVKAHGQVWPVLAVLGWYVDKDHRVAKSKLSWVLARRFDDPADAAHLMQLILSGEVDVEDINEWSPGPVSGGERVETVADIHRRLPRVHRR